MPAKTQSVANRPGKAKKAAKKVAPKTKTADVKPKKSAYVKKGGQGGARAGAGRPSRTKTALAAVAAGLPIPPSPTQPLPITEQTAERIKALITGGKLSTRDKVAAHEGMSIALAEIYGADNDHVPEPGHRYPNITSPMEYFIAVMMDPLSSPQRKDDAAKQLMPYVHEKMQPKGKGKASGIGSLVFAPRADAAVIDATAAPADAVNEWADLLGSGSPN